MEEEEAEGGEVEGEEVEGEEVEGGEIEMEMEMEAEGEEVERGEMEGKKRRTRASAQFQLKHPLGVLAQELGPDVVAERHLGHIRKDALQG